jgi:hypothetical protein
MKVSVPVLLAAALGVSAHPSGHGHRHAHRSLEARNEFVMYQKPPPPEPTTTSTTSTAAPPKPTTSSTTEEVKIAVATEEPSSTSSAAPKPKPSPDNSDDDSSSSGGSGLGVSTYTEFCGGNKKKRATLEEIAYKGNTGTDDNYGCNMMLVQSNVAEKYKYLAIIENIDDEDYECVAYNKIGPDGGINGFFDGHEAIRFIIPAGGKQHLAADENTQGGVICDKGSVPLTSFGEFASTWAEWDFGNESNDGWSGADASCLVAAALGLDIPGLQICGHDTCSTIYPGGDGENAFLGGMEALDGLGLNIAPGKVRLEVTYGFKGSK